MLLNNITKYIIYMLIMVLYIIIYFLYINNFINMIILFEEVIKFIK